MPKQSQTGVVPGRQPKTLVSGRDIYLSILLLSSTQAVFVALDLLARSPALCPLCEPETTPLPPLIQDTARHD